MTQPTVKAAVAFRAAGYLIFTIILAQTILDLLSSMAPMLPGLVAWRVRAEGLAAAAWTTPSLMLLLLGFLAFVSEHRKVLLTLTVVGAIFSLTFTVVSGLFVLDAVQMSKSVTPEGKNAYWIAAAYALARLGMAVITFGLLAWTSMRAARSLKKVTEVSAPRQAVLMGAAGPGR